MQPWELALLTTDEAGAFLKLAPQTLRRRHSEGTGPVVCKIGRRNLYRRADLEAFVLASRRTSTSDPGPQGHAPSSPVGERSR